jgi:FSR family fosmidomycin resistance protein-like MFS transporter
MGSAGMNANALRAVQAFSNAGHLFAHLLTLLFPTVVIALVHEWNMGYGELIALMLVGQILLGVGALPTGWLADRWSYTGMMVVFFIGSGVAAILVGLSDGPFGIAIALSLLGLFASIYHPVGFAWLIRNARQQGRAIGANGVWGGIGVALGPILAGVITDLVSWRAAFIIPGAVSLLTGLGLLIAWRLGWVADGTVDMQPRPEASQEHMRRALVVLTVTMACTGVLGTTLVLLLPKLFSEGLGSDGVMGVGTLVGSALLLSSATQYLGGRFADRYAAKSFYIVMVTVLGISLFATAAFKGHALIALAFLSMMLTAVFAPSENLLLARYSPVKWRSTAFGVRAMLNLGIGAVSIPLIALTYARFGSAAALLAGLGVLALMAAIIAQMLPSEQRAAA